MYIREYKDKYRAVQSYKDVLTGSHKTVSVIIDKNTPQERNKAQRRLDELVAEKQSIVPEDITVSRIIDMYLAFQLRTLKKSTVLRNTSVCNGFKAMFGHAKADNMSAAIVRDRFMSYTDSATTINEYIKRYKALMRWAYQNDLVSDVRYLDKLTPMQDNTRREKASEKFLERSEVDILIESMAHEKWRNLTSLLVLSGLRVGEALALDESDIDMTERLIRVTKTLSPTTHFITSTKTFTSTRDVFMQDELYDLMRQILTTNKQNRKVIRINGAPLFWKLDGSRENYGAYNKYLKDNSMKAIGRAITPHVLRHTHASLLAEAGYPLDAISRRLGHSDSKVTKEIYVHVTERRKHAEHEMLRKVRLL